MSIQKKKDQVKQIDTEDLPNETMQMDNDYTEPDICKENVPHPPPRQQQTTQVKRGWHC